MSAPAGRSGAIRRWPWFAAGLAVLAAGAGLAAVPPSSWPLPPCPTHALTGLHCPGCGTLRATHHLLNAEWLLAIRHNVLALGLLPAIGYGLAVENLPAGVAVRQRMRPISGRWAWTIVALVVAFGVARNLPWAPFDRLAPPPVASAAPEAR